MAVDSSPPVVVAQAPELPAGLAGLLAESERAGYRFVRGLADDWADSTERVERPGEALFVAWAGAELVGVCALTRDPHATDPSVGRLRRLYVLEAWRGRGVGAALVAAVIRAARGHFARLHLRAEEPGPARLYERHGFAPAGGVAGATHVLVFAAGAVEPRA